MEKISFDNITYRDLKKIVAIKHLLDDSQFNDWFSFSYTFTEDDNHFLERLVRKNRLKMTAYTEEELKAKFIIPLVNRVDFVGKDFSDWYERSIKTVINDWEISGITDFMVAKGEKEPESPYFFLQEFKPSKPNSFPEYQLIAELLVALNMNGDTLTKGVYIIGQHWYFAILKLIAPNQYNYFISQSFDSLKVEELKEIYKHLHAIKAEVINRVTK